MELSVANIVAAIINFGILYFILKRFLFDKVSLAIENRKNEIKSAFDNIESDKKDLEQSRDAVKLETKGLKEKGEKIYQSYKETAESKKDEILLKAHEEAKNIISQANSQVERERKAAQKDIEKMAVDLSIDLCKKVLQDSLDEETHKKIMKEFINKVDEINV